MYSDQIVHVHEKRVFKLLYTYWYTGLSTLALSVNGLHQVNATSVDNSTSNYIGKHTIEPKFQFTHLLV